MAERLPPPRGYVRASDVKSAIEAIAEEGCGFHGAVALAGLREAVARAEAAAEPLSERVLPRIPVDLITELSRAERRPEGAPALRLLVDFAKALGCEVAHDPEAGLCKAPIICHRPEGHDGDCDNRREVARG